MRQAVARHKTAISRTEPSRPIKLALADGLLTPDKSIFDYGCGLGDDLRFLNAFGVQSAGWDPVHRPDQELRCASVVNLGYVVNVIENPRERQEVLQRAWTLAEQILIVSARLTSDGRALGDVQAYADGLLTRRSTFQKFFEQQELRNWIDQTLEVAAVPAAPGVFYVFRDEEARVAFIASRFRRRLAVPRLTRSEAMYTEHEALLRPLMDFVGDRGRLPADDELASAADICSVFGSLRKAFRIVGHVTEQARWDEIAEERKQDLRIYLALSRFDGRPNFGQLPRVLQLDVKAFFTTYRQGCNSADELLFSLGRPGVVDSACNESSIGKLTPNALYVHRSALEALPSLLRLFEGCARGYLGRIEGANIIKLHRDEPRISYLSYPTFDIDPHPALASSLTVHLQTFRVRYNEFQLRTNPPILHRKELFLAPDHPFHAKFARLTRIEEQKGLYEDTSRIGTRDGWNEVLEQKGFYLKGHRLLSRAGSV